MKPIDKIKKEIDAFVDEIIELKAKVKELETELSKHPEIVRCGECLESQMGDCGLMCLRHDFMAVSENDYCSYGVRNPIFSRKLMRG